jgi:hypothetical protein
MSVADLVKFPHFQDEWLRYSQPQIWMAGGTTGMPKQRIGWYDYRTDYSECRDRIADLMASKGFAVPAVCVSNGHGVDKDGWWAGIRARKGMLDQPELLGRKGDEIAAPTTLLAAGKTQDSAARPAEPSPSTACPPSQHSPKRRLAKRTKGSNRERDSIFISYCHKDARWLELLQLMLAPLRRSQSIRLWSDREINPGNRWQEDIKTELKRAKLAVLLISPSFLASHFITNIEFPALLRSAQGKDLSILWVPVSASLALETELANYHPAADPDHPLDGLRPARRNQVLVQIAQKIKVALAA